MMHHRRVSTIIFFAIIVTSLFVNVSAWCPPICPFLSFEAEKVEEDSNNAQADQAKENALEESDVVKEFNENSKTDVEIQKNSDGTVEKIKVTKKPPPPNYASYSDIQRLEYRMMEMVDDLTWQLNVIFADSDVLRAVNNLESDMKVVKDDLYYGGGVFTKIDDLQSCAKCNEVHGNAGHLYNDIVENMISISGLESKVQDHTNTLTEHKALIDDNSDVDALQSRVNQLETIDTTDLNDKATAIGILNQNKYARLGEWDNILVKLDNPAADIYCWTADVASGDNNPNLHAAPCTGGDNQLFRYDNVTDVIFSFLGGSCLDYNPGTTNIYLHPCHGGNNQKFVMSTSTTPGEQNVIYTKNEGEEDHCIDMDTSTDYYNLVVWSGGCHFGWNQKFHSNLFGNAHLIGT